MPCWANSPADNACVLLHVQRSGDSGSPRVIGSTSFSSAGHTSGCATSYGRLPALRRTLTTSAGRAPARASSRPLRTVLIAMPVARATAATPPQPIAPASVPAHSRRARSSIVAFNRRHFWRTTFSAPAPTAPVDHAGVILSIPREPSRGRFDRLGDSRALRRRPCPREGPRAHELAALEVGCLSGASRIEALCWRGQESRPSAGEGEEGLVRAAHLMRI